MRQISLTLNENEFERFMDSLKSFKSAQILKSKQVDSDSDFGLTIEHKEMLDERRRQHLNGESKSFSWDEVRSNARETLKSKKSNS